MEWKHESKHIEQCHIIRIHNFVVHNVTWKLRSQHTQPIGKRTGSGHTCNGHKKPTSPTSHLYLYLYLRRWLQCFGGGANANTAKASSSSCLGWLSDWVLRTIAAPPTAGKNEPLDAAAPFLGTADSWSRSTDLVHNTGAPEALLRRLRTAFQVAMVSVHGFGV